MTSTNTSTGNGISADDGVARIAAGAGAAAGAEAGPDELAAQISAFIREAFLDGDPRGELDEKTPLLEWGVLSSLKMAQLLAFLREGLAEPDRVKVPALEISARNFKNVRTIADLVHRLARS